MAEDMVIGKPLVFRSTLWVGDVYEEKDVSDSNTNSKDYKVVQKSMVYYTCIPKKIIVLMMVMGTILALLALCVSIYFMFFRYLIGQEEGKYNNECNKYGRCLSLNLRQK